MTLSLWRERPSGREDGRTKKRAARRLARSLRFFYATLRGLLAVGFGSTFFCPRLLLCGELRWLLLGVMDGAVSLCANRRAPCAIEDC